MEAAHSMPLLAFGEERFHPYLALAHRFAIGLRLVIRAHPLQIGLREVAVQLPAMVAGRTLCLERAGISDGGLCPGLCLFRLVLPPVRRAEPPPPATLTRPLRLPP